MGRENQGNVENLYFPHYRVPKWEPATENKKRQITGNFSDSDIWTFQQSHTLREIDIRLTSAWQEYL